MIASTVLSTGVSFSVAAKPTTGVSFADDPILRLLPKCNTATQFPPILTVVVKSDRTQDPRLLFKLIRLCSEVGSMDYATKIFENILRRDVYHYTAFMSGAIANRACREAVCVYVRMIEESIRPDSFVISHGLRACGIGSDLDVGRQIQGQAIKFQFGLNRHVNLRLTEFYCKCGEFQEARKVFGEMPEKDVVAATILITCYADCRLIECARAVFDGVVEEKDTVCWTAMIDAYVRNKKMNDALELFRRMQRENISPNEVTIVCVLSACSQLGALELGRWVHSYYIGRRIVRQNAHVGPTLIDMYSKCGSLEEAKAIFNAMPNKDVVAYNSMIAGLALHGKTHEAVELFTKLVEQGLTPSPVSFVGVLNACSHGGMVDLGFEFFEKMTKIYNIKPRIEHYGCMVDLLGRIGRLNEAYTFITKMCGVEADEVIWGSLLSACKIHGNLELGEKIAEILLTKHHSSSSAGTYILLSNTYASFGKWDEAARVRGEMKNLGIQKEPGCSSIEVDNTIHEFLLGDNRHPRRHEIYQKLEEVISKVKSEGGYIACKESVLQDIGEEEKEWALSIHSERLAICYGLISTEEGTTIRVVKNLRVCNDCHNVIKLVSKVMRRKIVVRDRKRFHVFEDGVCSCEDYW